MEQNIRKTSLSVVQNVAIGSAMMRKSNTVMTRRNHALIQALITFHYPETENNGPLAQR